MGKATQDQIESAITELLRNREGTICPSEAARRVFPDDWREHMEEVREVGKRLSQSQIIRITQNGCEVPVKKLKGPVRFARGPKF